MRNIRYRGLQILSLTLLLFAGCNDYVSLFPLYDDSTLAVTPSLEGSWKTSERDIWTFVRQGRKYRLTVMDHEDNKAWEFEAGLVELERVDIAQPELGAVDA